MSELELIDRLVALMQEQANIIGELLKANAQMGAVTTADDRAHSALACVDTLVRAWSQP